MISDFTEQYFGGNKNWVNAKFELLLNHSSLIIMVKHVDKLCRKYFQTTINNLRKYCLNLKSKKVWQS